MLKCVRVKVTLRAKVSHSAFLSPTQSNIFAYGQQLVDHDKILR